MSPSGTRRASFTVPEAHSPISTSTRRRQNSPTAARSPGGTYACFPPSGVSWNRTSNTTRFGKTINDEVERFLFGAINTSGARAVRAFAGNNPQAIHNHFQSFFAYLDAQKLRTPKGLDWIEIGYPRLTQFELMEEMQRLRQMHCAMWIECVREIVSAKKSDVKFIVTDHPVTAYNAACPPGSPMCQYPDDPPITLNGTQTVFALDGDHCLILTNLEYAKDARGVDILAPRQNARYLGSSLVRTNAMIRTRSLTRDEVVSINSLLKAGSPGRTLPKSYAPRATGFGTSAAKYSSDTRTVPRAIKIRSVAPNPVTSS